MTKLRIILVVGAIAAITSCGEDAVAPAAPAAGPRPKAAPVIAAAVSDGGTPAELPQYTYSYNPVGKRDPFRSPIDERKGEKPTDGANDICPEPLCQFDLEQLALVAVVSGDANPVAMLEDANKIGHIVRRNTKVGKQGGKVSQILRDCIEVTEFFLSPDGKKVPNRVSICVKKEDKVERAYDLFNNKATE
jgi:type IV pilus assembly protein PilP